MSVSDPLLKTLKAYIHQLRTDTRPITDEHETLQPFCETLEEIIRKGMRQNTFLFGLQKKDYWNWIEAVAMENNHQSHSSHAVLQMVVSMVKSSGKCFSNQGRGRLFLRLALQKKVLSAAIEKMYKNPTLLEQWYDPYSIVGDEILHEILMSLLHQVPEINFDLCTKNASFLDETWMLPVHRSFELVPCTDIGIQVQFFQGRAIVSKVEQGSVAEEDGKVGPGDVMDDLLGETLKGIKKGRMSYLLKQNQGFPINMSVCKCKLSNGSVYPPIRKLLQELGHDINALHNILAEDHRSHDDQGRIPPHAQLPEDDMDEVPVHNAEDTAGYKVKYVGSINVGQYGGVHQVEVAISDILKKKSSKEGLPVFMELGETDIIVKDAETKEQILKHSYTEVSACGRRMDHVNYFAYLAGETTCTLAKHFIAHIFKAGCDEESKTILCSIAQGFGRTHWFV